ncbi:MAG: helicase associated domain-containing protein [Verrucomicrobia bacterium]|nr:helicase associated domain-containing protein [Verrucomicrobiota bacterium]
MKTAKKNGGDAPSQTKAWDEMAGLLEAFTRRFGHCRVPRHWPEEPRLARWVQTQRLRHDRLSLDQLRRLHELGFDFGFAEGRWIANLLKLVRFKESHGHCNVSSRWSRDPQLAKWVHGQRVEYRRGQLYLHRTARLNQVGFEWNLLGKTWHQRFQELKQFKERYGHCRPVREPEATPALQNWVGWQRKQVISPERKRLLDSIGFIWNPLEQVWEEWFRRLVEFKRRHGHCRVTFSSMDPALASWVRVQRLRPLSRERRKRLESVGFDFSPFRCAWERKFQELVAYKKRHGHPNVSLHFDEDYQLARWLHKQRRRQTQGRLQPERKRRLEALGVFWRSLDFTWEQRFKELQAFKKRFGHCRVHQRWPENRHLGNWVRHLRDIRNRLSEARRQKLDAIGFDWDPVATRWERRFEKLKAFKKKFGHCRVPTEWTGNRGLNLWVMAQKRGCAQMSPERVRRLRELGFWAGRRQEPS